MAIKNEIMEQINTSNRLNLSTSHEKQNGKRQRSWGAMVRVKTRLEGRKWAMGKERNGSKEMLIKNEIIEQTNKSNGLNLSTSHEKHNG